MQRNQFLNMFFTSRHQSSGQYSSRIRESSSLPPPYISYVRAPHVLFNNWIIHLQSIGNVFRTTIVTSLQHCNQSLIHNAMAGICSACANDIVAADRIVKCQSWWNSEIHFSCSGLSEELSRNISHTFYT